MHFNLGASHGPFQMYYGSEFVTKKVQDWIKGRGIGAVFIEPGSPWQNGHNESFNGVFRPNRFGANVPPSVRSKRSDFRFKSTQLVGSGGWT